MDLYKQRRRPGTRLAGLLGSALIVSLALMSFAPAVGAVGTAPVSDQACGYNPLDVELILDTSGSMGTQTGANTRLGWAKLAANQLVSDLDSHGGVGTTHHVGLTRFSGTTASTPMALGTSTAAQATSAINALTANGATPFKTGMAAGALDLHNNMRTVDGDGNAVTHVIIFLSDGRPNPDGPTNGSYATNNSSQRPTLANVTSFQADADGGVFSIGVGIGGSGLSQVDTGLMALLDSAPGTYTQIVDASNLPTLFESIFHQIACTGTLTVIKHVDNGDGGDALASDFTMNVDGVNPSDTGFPGDEQGTKITLGVGDYSVSESGGPSDFDATYSEGCKGTIAAGEDLTCTVTNTYSPPPSITYCIDVSKLDSATQESLQGAGFTVYFYDSDEVAAGPSYTNSDGMASFCGLSADDYTVVETTPPPGYAAASEYQDVSFPKDCPVLDSLQTFDTQPTGCTVQLTFLDRPNQTPPPPPPPDVHTPSIHIVKSASAATVVSGSSVTYTYKVTNTGSDALLKNIVVSDDKCSPVTYVSGDTSADTFLQNGETWTYTCTKNLTATTTNIATVTGAYLTQTVSDTDQATVTVTPGGGGGVLGATGRPRVTLPPTNTLDGENGSSPSSNLGLILLVLAGLATMVGFLTPVPSRSRRRNGRE